MEMRTMQGRINNKKQSLRLAWRIGLPHYETDEAFANLLQFVRQQRRIIDELALFETITHHQYIPLDIYARRMELAAGRMDALRKAGVASVGVNVLCTIGHINEAWSYMPPLPYPGMVGHDGSVSKGCACPNTPEMRKYVRAKYELVARARPEFIWVDDDIRVHHHGVAWGCFCETCLQMFSQKAGQSFRRETLVKALNDPAQTALRQAWIQQNIATIESLLTDVSAAVKEVDPGIGMGLMTNGPAWTTYSGMGFARWFPALRATKARPGGGFYSDAVPGEMLRKNMDCGWQRAALPVEVQDIQYEVENFPYQILKKSASALINECTLALAQGHNGIAFNLNALTVAYEDFLPLIQDLPSLRPLWEKWTAHAAGLPTAGLWPAWSPQLMAKRVVRPGEDWFGGSGAYDITRPLILSEIGLPLAVDRPGCGTILSGRVAEVFSTEELKEMLAQGVVMDSTALEVLTQRRLAYLTGVRIGRRTDNGMRERFTDDKANGPFAGHVRDARIEFWGDAKGMGDVLVPTAKGVRRLATLEDYFGRQQGACLTAFENSLGGRVVVMGYAPWIFLHSVAKRQQLQNVADWVSRGRLPVRVDEPVRLTPVVRMSADGRRVAILLLNAGMDAIPAATVHMRSRVARVRLLAPGEKDRTITIQREKTGGVLTLRDIPAWGFRMILA